MTNIPYAQADEVAGPEVTVQTKIKERKLPGAVSKLQSYADCPDVFEL